MTADTERLVEEESDPQLLQRLGDDAAKWAFEFRRTAIRLGYSAMDEGWLIGWFANAIENAEITRRSRALLSPAGGEGERYRTALQRIAMLDEADGHELTRHHAYEAVAIATVALGKHPSEIFAAPAAPPDFIDAEAMNAASKIFASAYPHAPGDVTRAGALIADAMLKVIAEHDRRTDVDPPSETITWVYMNPHAAAKEIDRLRGALTPARQRFHREPAPLPAGVHNAGEQ